MHVDPLVVTAKAVLDGTGHPSEVIELRSKKAGVELATPHRQDHGRKTDVDGKRRGFDRSQYQGTLSGTVCLRYGGQQRQRRFSNGTDFRRMLMSGPKVAELMMERINA